MEYRLIICSKNGPEVQATLIHPGVAFNNCFDQVGSDIKGKGLLSVI